MGNVENLKKQKYLYSKQRQEFPLDLHKIYFKNIQALAT